ncbi:unnamed protein product [Amoebophrya sp. A25]|nr:unnamed protein product [Amoebophrya sp. A25]|eukprot:GSA25T00016336001.1
MNLVHLSTTIFVVERSLRIIIFTENKIMDYNRGNLLLFEKQNFFGVFIVVNAHHEMLVDTSTGETKRR